MAVPNLIGTGTGFPPALDELYINTGVGFESTPSWHNTEEDNSFTCAFGDYDLDGDPDLVTETGYFTIGTIKLYRNDGGTLSTSATWESDDDEIAAGDVEWCDVDRDGDLDLFAVGSDEVFKAAQPIRIFKNNSGTLETTPYWVSDNTGEFNQMSFADIDGDGYFELAASETGQGSGYQKVYIYDNVAGTLQTSPMWEDNLTFCSAARFADVDGDGDYDLAAGGWWAPVVVYLNDGAGGFASTPDWSYSDMGSSMVCEQIVFSDIDKAGVVDKTDYFSGDGSNQLIYVDRIPMLDIPEITVDGNQLDPDEYCFDMEYGWVSFASPPASGTDNIAVEYKYSTSLDMLITNWNDSRGAIMFMNNHGIGDELLAFKALPGDNNIEVIWYIDIDGSHIGYDLYRADSFDGERIKLNKSLIDSGTYGRFIDRKLENDETYYYWLKQIKSDYETITFGPVSASPGLYHLSEVKPNPGADKVVFSFAVPFRENVNLTIYDLKGRAVGKVCNSTFKPGEHEIEYDVSYLVNGVYIYNISTDGFTTSKKMIVNR
jgi:hypothetical protein